MKLSIIIPSYNTKKLLRDCLRSVYSQTKEIDFEVVVIDNNSSDGSVKMVKNEFPSVKLAVNQDNLGYGRANNLGLAMAEGEYVLFLNSDTIVLDQAIDRAVGFMEQKKRPDILGVQLLNQDRTIQPSGGYFPTLLRVFYMMFFIDDLILVNRLIKPYQQSRKSFYQQVQQLDWVTGAFLLVSRKAAEQLGGFDQDYFMYAEEVDFCFRAAQRGLKTWFYPQARLVHLKGRSSADGFQAAVLGEYRGLKSFFKGHRPAWQGLVLNWLLKAGALLRIFIFGILKGNQLKRRTYEQAFKLA